MKDNIKKKYEEDIEAIDKQISDNLKKYKFLHTLLTGTGDELVAAMISFLKWLGFDKVIDRDTIQKDGEPLEEDIDIDFGDEGLLVIEVKGIGGTSTDAQCSQIHKIVFRRSKERGRFDVKGLYIVNNEMHLDPLRRTIPPFNNNQIQDAENDGRGLAYSLQFFNLFYNINNGFITKDEAREMLMKKGLLNFEPKFVSAGMPYKYYKDETVACIELKNQEIKIGDFLCYEKNGRWERAKVISIQKDHYTVNKATNGRFGFGFDKAVIKNCELFIESREKS